MFAGQELRTYFFTILLPPLCFSIFYLIFRNDFAGLKARIGKVLLYSSFISLAV
jgi:hypothetical protein